MYILTEDVSNFHYKFQTLYNYTENHPERSPKFAPLKSLLPGHGAVDPNLTSR